MPHQKIKTFFSEYPEIKYKSGETILRAEDEPQGILYLSKGYVRQFFVTTEGHEFTFNIFKPKSFFPLSWAITKTPNNYFYEAMTNVVINRAPVDEFLEFITNKPDILLDINKRLLVGMDSLLIRMPHLILDKSPQIIAEVLFLLHRRFGEIHNGKIKINFPITQQEIANLSGLSRETVCLELNKLMKSKVLLRKKRIYVINRPKMLEKIMKSPENFSL